MLEDVKMGDEYFDEGFFMYADDTDLGWRAALRGWKSIYAPDALVYHLHSASSESYSPLKSVGLLAELGPALGFPYSSRVNASRHSHMRELRTQSAGKPLRTLYAFGPLRTAILLVGGDKIGDDRWYVQLVPVADRLYDRHLDELKKEGEL